MMLPDLEQKVAYVSNTGREQFSTSTIHGRRSLSISGQSEGANVSKYGAGRTDFEDGMTITPDISREVGRVKGRRKSSFGSKRHKRSRRQSDTPATLSHLASSNHYDMDIVIQPPLATQLSAVLDPPIVVSIDTSSTLAGDSVAGGPSLWGMAILTSETGEIRQDILAGNPVNSVRPLFSAGPCCGTLESTKEYLIFRNLRITQPGRYKFRIKLVQMNDSSLTTTTGQSAFMQQEVESRIVDARSPPVVARELGKRHAASTHAHLSNEA